LTRRIQHFINAMYTYWPIIDTSFLRQSTVKVLYL